MVIQKEGVRMNIELTEVTTNLNSKEIKVLDEIAKEKGMSRDTILRQSLRIYQIVETLSKKGKIDLNHLMKEAFGELHKSNTNKED